MRSEKTSIVDEVKDKLSDAIFVIVTDYTGLNVSKAEDLRGRLRGADSRLMIVKNRALRRVAGELEFDGLAEQVAGPSAVVYGHGDAVQTAKILKDFIKENDLPLIKVGALRGVVLSAEDIQHLADLPSREQLYAMVVGTIAAPMTQLVGVMNQKVSSLLYVLRAIEDKKKTAA